MRHGRLVRWPLIRVTVRGQDVQLDMTVMVFVLDQVVNGSVRDVLPTINVVVGSRAYQFLM